MVKVRGKRKSQKAWTKHGNLTKSGVKFSKVGGIRNVLEIGGMDKKTKIEGENFKFVGDD